MRLFDFLKPKQAIVTTAPNIANRQECDITKTGVIAKLFKIPKDKRDNSWYQSFYQNVATASFACADPQLMTGPDNFPYFILNTPEENKSFESFCIQNMKDDFLLNRGWGIVFNPAKDKTADWVFTYGDIVNLHLNNEFFAKIEAAATGNVIIKKEEKMMIAQPSETYLPGATKNALKIFLQSKGIKTPKLMMLTSECEGKIIRKLVFNIHPENFPVCEDLDYLMRQVSWFLPNHYILIPLPKQSELAAGFHDM